MRSKSDGCKSDATMMAENPWQGEKKKKCHSSTTDRIVREGKEIIWDLSMGRSQPCQSKSKGRHLTDKEKKKWETLKKEIFCHMQHERRPKWLPPGEQGGEWHEPRLERWEKAICARSQRSSSWAYFSWL